MLVGIAYRENNMLINHFGLKLDCFDYIMLVVFSILCACGFV